MNRHVELKAITGSFEFAVCLIGLDMDLIKQSFSCFFNLYLASLSDLIYSVIGTRGEQETGWDGLYLSLTRPLIFYRVNF